MKFGLLYQQLKKKSICAFYCNIDCGDILDVDFGCTIHLIAKSGLKQNFQKLMVIML